jgi:hypothetical protein
MRPFVRRLLPWVDCLASPWVYPAAWLLRSVRRTGLHRLPRCRNALLRVGVLPINRHYYEPRFDFQADEFAAPRHLPGIAWDAQEQLAFLARLTFTDELSALGRASTAQHTFRFGNGQFESGDAECWYQVVRALKPRRIVEIGSGHSTLLACAAIARNRTDDPTYVCEHTCIEPYERPWLEQLGVTVLRQAVEQLDPQWFSALAANDILFIDSSHVIRPRGDVLFEYLEILPRLARGVVVHVHDIFTPRDYPRAWMVDELRLWNEQYLLEAFLTHNRAWTILAALNFLHHAHYPALARIAPYLDAGREPGSLYLQRVA